MLLDIGEQQKPANRKKKLLIPLDLDNVSDETLGHIFSWITHWQHQPKPDAEAEADAAKKEIDFTHPATMTSWDRDFFKRVIGPKGKLNGQAMYELLVATNYLDIPPLYRMAVGVIAEAMDDLSPEDLTRMIDHAHDGLDRLLDFWSLSCGAES